MASSMFIKLETKMYYLVNSLMLRENQISKISRVSRIF
jgi:hypothetical protein